MLFYSAASGQKHYIVGFKHAAHGPKWAHQSFQTGPLNKFAKYEQWMFFADSGFFPSFWLENNRL